MLPEAQVYSTPLLNNPTRRASSNVTSIRRRNATSADELSATKPKVMTEFLSNGVTIKTRLALPQLPRADGQAALVLPCGEVTFLVFSGMSG